MKERKAAKTGRQGNPPDSPWRSTPDSLRGNKRMNITLPQDVIDDIKAEAERSLKPYSQVIADAVRAYVRARKPKP